jgi:hypothetical protein
MSLAGGDRPYPVNPCLSYLLTHSFTGLLATWMQDGFTAGDGPKIIMLILNSGA